MLLAQGHQPPHGFRLAFRPRFSRPARSSHSSAGKGAGIYKIWPPSSNKGLNSRRTHQTGTSPAMKPGKAIPSPARGDSAAHCHAVASIPAAPLPGKVGYCSITTIAERGGIHTVADAGCASGCSGVADSKRPENACSHGTGTLGKQRTIRLEREFALRFSADGKPYRLPARVRATWQPLPSE
jgi:hypothetical protein